MRRAAATAAARTRVPTTAEVVAGARVNIVLKADQPTGRTVAGTVRDVLTRGNHPRGIKVRLADGRVGRVQTMASTSEGDASESATQDDESSSGAFALAGEHQTFAGSGQHNSRRSRNRGGREEQDRAPEPQAVGLDAYVKQAKPRRKGKQTAGQTFGDAAANDAAPAPTVTCPVCGAFEGDEAAVAHHVASHFDC
ncbi:uncharacterized protein E0L32_002290 [Thyridium curvatum]|uniref:UBZ4-type domain-containing protein n=1 Tax=Thyridium curvatum TaxID=1093900 RepID=A0A507AL45_9PEZI|nr:uncharacterized protein E0L32_002290 [Thyridium curvatum]TPX06794.1 hypothetical protein E0L32_002290 [Thyridium curvatum]